MDRDLLKSLLRFINEASNEELQAKKEHLLQCLELHRPLTPAVISEIRRLVRLMDEELSVRESIERRQQKRRSRVG